MTESIVYSHDLVEGDVNHIGLSEFERRFLNSDPSTASRIVTYCRGRREDCTVLISAGAIGVLFMGALTCFCQGEPAAQIAGFGGVLACGGVSLVGIMERRNYRKAIHFLSLRSKTLTN